MLGAFPKNFSTAAWIAGMRVDPPTKIISLISEVDKPAFFKADLQGSIVLLIKLSANCSNFARVNCFTKCLGIPLTGIMYGKLISEVVVLDNSILAFSAASFKRCKAIGSLRKSIPSSFLNSSANQSIIKLSKSSPPKCVSPSVDFTSNTPSPNSKTDTSCVPPPQSKTIIFISFPFLSIP